MVEDSEKQRGGGRGDSRKRKSHELHEHRAEDLPNTARSCQLRDQLAASSRPLTAATSRATSGHRQSRRENGSLMISGRQVLLSSYRNPVTLLTIKQADSTPSLSHLLC